jgi:hypothetical protein
MGKIRDLAEDVLSSDVKDALIGAGIVVVDGLADVSDRIAGQMKKQSGNKGNKLYDKFDKYAKKSDYDHCLLVINSKDTGAYVFVEPGGGIKYVGKHVDSSKEIFLYDFDEDIIGLVSPVELHKKGFLSKKLESLKEQIVINGYVVASVEYSPGDEGTFKLNTDYWKLWLKMSDKNVSVKDDFSISGKKKDFKGAHILEFNDPVKEILLALMLIAITELKKEIE